MSNSAQPLTFDSPWPHRLAVVLCCATFPLVWVGGLVTTYNAGMAVPDWPNTYGYNLFLYPIETWLYGPWDILVEHGHRLFASLVGIMTIALCVVAWRSGAPGWIKLLASAALVWVIGQGVLGGMRVLFDARAFAKIHGCVGPLFFAFTAVLATVTSRRWLEGRNSIDGGSSPAVLLMTLVTPLLAFIQLVLGAHVRHFPVDGAPSAYRAFLLFHIVVGVALAVHILVSGATVWLKTRGGPGPVAALVRPAALLVGLILLQLTLGAATWIYKFNWPAFMAGSVSPEALQALDWRQAQITTAHVAIGSLILAVSTMLAVRTARMVRYDGTIMSPGATWKGAPA